MKLKKDFPIFKHRPDLVYLDNAATTQKPKAVLEAMERYYTNHNSNVHRGPNFLSEESSIAYDDARKVIADYIYASNKESVIFTRNATESINLVAYSFGLGLSEGDEVLLSKLEHHSNLVPWLQLAERQGMKLKYFDVDDGGRLIFDHEMITEKTKLVAITGMSNSLGVMPDLAPIIEAAHGVGAKVLVDASQLIVHERINVQTLDADFVVFSGHKLYGPMGIGVLWGKRELLEAMPPFLGGGDMINQVFTDNYTPNSLPNKFEAGTPNVAGVVGLAAAIRYMESVGLEKIRKHEKELTEYALEKMNALEFIQLIGPTDASDRGAIISFSMQGVHPHDVAEGLSSKGVCIRAGHHCTQVLMDALGINATCRVSIGMYNDKQDIDKLVEALEATHKYFA